MRGVRGRPQVPRRGSAGVVVMSTGLLAWVGSLCTLGVPPGVVGRDVASRLTRERRTLLGEGQPKGVTGALIWP